MAKTIKPGTKGVITLAQFMATPEFLACADKQRRWLQTLVESGFNYALANATAFDNLTPRRALLYGYAVRRQPHVVAALQVYLGTTDADVLKEQRQDSVQHLLRRVRFQIKHVEAGSVAAQRFLAQEERLLLGGRIRIEDADDDEPAAKISKPQASAPVSIPPGDPASAKRFKVGDIVVERDDAGVDHRGRVTAVDPDGQITDAEEFPS